MNVENVRSQLRNNPDNIIKILLKLGFEEESIIIVERQNLLKMPRPNGDNPAGILIYYDSLKVIGTTDSSYTGDIFTLVMNIREYSFYNAINKIIKWLNLKDVPIHYPFGGFYKQIYSRDNKSEIELTEHPLSYNSVSLLSSVLSAINYVPPYTRKMCSLYFLYHFYANSCRKALPKHRVKHTCRI